MTLEATSSMHVNESGWHAASAPIQVTPTVAITIAHTSLLVGTCLTAMLGALPEFDVRLWSQAGAMPLARGGTHAVHIVIGDVEMLARIARDDGARPWEADPGRMKFVLITPSEQAAPIEALDSLPISACVSVDCQADDLVGTLRGLSCRFAPSRASGARAQVRGGLAPGALRRVREHIQSRLGDRIQLSDLAAIAELSDCHFARAFKQSMGMPPHQYVMKQRIEVAALLIEQTDRPLAEIALEVGFSDQSHFTRMFSRLARQTPRDYRHSYR